MMDRRHDTTHALRTLAARIISEQDDEDRRAPVDLADLRRSDELSESEDAERIRQLTNEIAALGFIEIATAVRQRQIRLCVAATSRAPRLLKACANELERLLSSLRGAATSAEVRPLVREQVMQWAGSFAGPADVLDCYEEVLRAVDKSGIPSKPIPAPQANCPMKSAVSLRHSWGGWEADPGGVTRRCACGAVDWRPHA